MSDAAQPVPLKKFIDLLDVPREERVRQELRMLEGLMAQALQKGKYTEALKIFEAAQSMLNRHGRK
jgi:hypothetical protein